MPLIEERTISGKGILIVPDNNNVKEARLMTLYASVIRRPINEYLNFKYNPPKGFYATLVFERETFVVREETLEYPDQLWDFSPEKDFQNLYALDCVYEGILATFVNLGLALSLPPISVQNTIALYRHTDLWFDKIKVTCYGGTAIKLSLVSKAYDFCPEQPGVTPDPPPPPPSVIEEIPAGTPLTEENGVSPPYDGSTFDDGDTDPFELDLYQVPPPPPPSGEECEQYPIRITYQAELDSGEVVTTNINQTVYGQYNLDVVLIYSDANPELVVSIGLFAQGIVSPATQCGEYGYVQFQASTGGIKILSATATLV
jgi:hypothetical protein